MEQDSVLIQFSEYLKNPNLRPESELRNQPQQQSINNQDSSGLRSTWAGLVMIGNESSGQTGQKSTELAAMGSNMHESEMKMYYQARNCSRP